jgi:hypothetical protein
MVVWKADRKLLVYRAGRVVRQFPVELSDNWIERKRWSGDNAVPEGLYHVTARKQGACVGAAPTSHDVPATRKAIPMVRGTRARPHVSFTVLVKVPPPSLGRPRDVGRRESATVAAFPSLIDASTIARARAGGPPWLRTVVAGMPPEADVVPCSAHQTEHLLSPEPEFNS